MGRKNLTDKIEQLESKVSDLQYELEVKNEQLQEEIGKRNFYQLIADFTHDWELWLNPNGTVKYCLPSCYDLTGFTVNQIIATPSVSDLLVYRPDKKSLMSL